MRKRLSRWQLLTPLLIGFGGMAAAHPRSIRQLTASPTSHAQKLRHPTTLLTLQIGSLTVTVDSTSTLPAIRRALGAARIDTVGQTGDMMRQLCYSYGDASSKTWLDLGSSVMGGDSMFITEYTLKSTPMTSTHCARLRLPQRDVRSTEGVYVGIGIDEFKARTSPQVWAMHGDSATYEATDTVSVIWPETGKLVDETAVFGSVAVFQKGRLSSLDVWKVTAY